MASADELNRKPELKSVEEKVYICDIQGFQRVCEDSFIFKEISFLNIQETAIPTSYLFKPPIEWKKLSKEEKCIIRWLEKNHHGIAWNSGDIPYRRVQRILEICLHGVKRLYVKGEQQKQLLSNFLKDVLIINVENMGCPRLEEIKNDIKHICLNHEFCLRKPPKCAVNNVVTIRTWLRNYLKSKFIQEVNCVTHKMSLLSLK